MKQTPWLDRNFDFKRDAGAWPVIVCRIQGTAPRLHALVSGLSDAHTSGQLEGKWSIKDHIGHLTDLEALWLGRLQDFNANLEVLRPADMSNAATHKADHSSVSLIRLLSDFETQRAQLVEALHQVTQQKVAETAYHERLNVNMRLIDAFEFVAEHDDHHLTSISVLRLD